MVDGEVDGEEKYNCRNVIKENKQWLGLKATEKNVKWFWQYNFGSRLKGVNTEAPPKWTEVKNKSDEMIWDGTEIKES